ncbi:MAG: hypothetical protein JOZ57_10730, partial [Abitibacteriaceae bacterium]|nr:hypothetical protein [Abditibacteriaceae bacterium]
MKIEVSRVELQNVLRLRDLYRQELNCQIVHDCLHERGRTAIYLIAVDGAVAGYGALAHGDPRDTVIEFYTLPIHHPSAHTLFRELLAVSQAVKVQAQTNDVLLHLMLHDFTRNVKSDTILFADKLTTRHHLPDVIFRKATEADADHIFRHTHEPVGDWVLETANTIVATGGVYFHY